MDHLYDICERQEKLLDTWRLALQLIANSDDGGRLGRIALEALDKEKP
jgi:hypothetical protein